MDCLDIIGEYYEKGTVLHEILIQHGENVAKKALDAAKNVSYLNPDLDFIKHAAMLHDIGIFLTNMPKFGCTGKYPYICHGYLGRNLLEKKGMPMLALVCERHVGVGITPEDIRRYNLPLPERNMEPVSIEEQIICYADKFFSKNRYSGSEEKSVQDIKLGLEQYGHDKVAKFQSWFDMFEGGLDVKTV